MGNLESRELGLIGNAVLSDDVLAGRLSIAHRQRDGFYENVDTDAAYDNRDRRSVRAQLLWTPSADVDVRVILDDTNKDEDCCPAAFWITGPTSPVVAALGGDITPFAVDDASMVGVNSEPFEDVSDSGQSVDITWRMPQGATFRSISALRDFEVARDQDVDFTNADIAAPTDTDESFQNFSQEFQLHGESGRLAWLVGAYFYTEEAQFGRGHRLRFERGNLPRHAHRRPAGRPAPGRRPRRARHPGPGLRRGLLLRHHGLVTLLPRRVAG